MAGSRYVKDVMVPAVQLEANITAGEARDILNQRIVRFGVVRDVRGVPRIIVAREHLDAVQESIPVLALPASMSHPVPIEPHDTLDSIVLARANDFVSNHDLIGIVVQEQGKGQGVLLRETIEKHELVMLNARRLPGAPIVSLLFRCSQCLGNPTCPGVRVVYYDPNNPPECPQDKQRKMKRAKS